MIDFVGIPTSCTVSARQLLAQHTQKWAQFKQREATTIWTIGLSVNMELEHQTWALEERVRDILGAKHLKCSFQSLMQAWGLLTNIKTRKRRK